MTLVTDLLQHLLSIVGRALTTEHRVNRGLVDHDVEDAVLELHRAAVLRRARALRDLVWRE